MDMDHDCCGVAGTYGLKREKYAIAMAVGKPLFERIRGSGAREAACDSETCRWHIAQATGLPIRHPVELLAAAYAAGDVEVQPGSQDARGVGGVGRLLRRLPANRLAFGSHAPFFIYESAVIKVFEAQLTAPEVRSLMDETPRALLQS